MIGADGEMVDGVYLIPEILNAAYVQPQIAAYVTAYARVYYHKLMMRIGQDNIVYGDTDSIVCRADSELPFGMLHPTAFGALKREVSWATFQASAPKTYRGVTIDGTAVFKAKGMPARLRAELKGDEQTVTWDYLPSLRTRLKTGQPLEMVTATRSLPLAVNPRRWRTMDDGTVRPIILHEGGGND
jgi:hypothetical protein